jgi:hypothetical protein
MTDTNYGTQPVHFVEDPGYFTETENEICNTYQ